MPKRRGARQVARVLTVAAIALAVVVVAFALFVKGDEPYRITLSLDNASQLVKGNQVKVGGVPVGSVSKLELGPDARAQLELSIDDPKTVPLHRGTRAEVRATSLSGVANRYVSLTPGPVTEPKIPDGGTIPAEDATSQVDLDQLLNTLDPETLRDLQHVVRGGSAALRGRGPALGRAIDSLNPALSQVERLEREVLRDQGTFARFLIESADVVSAVASRREQVERMVGSGRATLEELASRDAELDSLLRRLPPTLRITNTTLVNLRAALRDLDPTIKLAQPVAAPLADTLGRLRPVARDARPVIASLRRTIDRGGTADLVGVLERLPRLRQIAVPALDSATATVRDALPVVTELRPYTPDLVGGQLNGFGGSTSGYYDANGHFTRISFQSNAYSLEGILSLAPITDLRSGIAGFRNGVVGRCPGAATQPAPDRSNPRIVPGCDPGDGTP